MDADVSYSLEGRNDNNLLCISAPGKKLGQGGNATQSSTSKVAMSLGRRTSCCCTLKDLACESDTKREGAMVDHIDSPFRIIPKDLNEL